MNNEKQKKLIIISFLFIPMILMFTFSIYPIAKMVFNSFTDWNGMDSEYNFVWFDNYYDIITKGELIEIFSHNLAYIILGLLVIIFSLLTAVLLNSKIKGSNLIRAIIFLPYIVNNVAAGFMFRYIYDYEDGVLNTFLDFFQIDKIQWLGNEKLVNYSLALVMAWQITGFFLTIFLGGLQSIDASLYEVARIDGATSWQTLRYIIIPNLSKVIELSLFLIINWSMKAFDQPFIITNGGPAGASDTFVTRTIQLAFQYQDYGKASAMGVILLAIVFTITYFQRRDTSRKEVA